MEENEVVEEVTEEVVEPEEVEEGVYIVAFNTNGGSEIPAEEVEPTEEEVAVVNDEEAIEEIATED